MSNTPHELAEEFPAAVEKMSRLKQEDAHFAKLHEEYHEVNRAIHRAETRVDAVTDDHETALRQRRMRLKDMIAAILAAT